MRKMAMPCEIPLQLRIITCLFVACSWNLVFEVVLNLKLNWFLNSSWTLLSWGSCSSVYWSLCVLVGLCAVWLFGVLVLSLLWPAVWSSWTVCSRSVVGSLMQRKSKPAALGRSCKGHATWCNYVVINVHQAHPVPWQRQCKAQLQMFWADNQGFRRQHHRRTLSLEVQKPRFQVEKLEKQIWKRCFSLFWIVFEWS